MGMTHGGKLRRVREAAAGSSAPALERGQPATAFTGDNDPSKTSGSEGDDTKQCPTCNGDGTKDGEVCASCHGSGAVMKESGAPAASDKDTKTCPTCHGTGKVLGGNVTCQTCHGTGKVPANFEPKADTGNPFAKAKEADPRLSFASDFVDLRECSALHASWSDGALVEAEVKRMSEKDYSTPTRIQAAKDGKAIPVKNSSGEIVGGSFPILDGGDLDDAVSAYGQNATPEVKAHIVKQAKALNATDKLPADWTGSTKESASADLEARMENLEALVRMTNGLRESQPDHMSQSFGDITRVKNSRKQDGYAVTLIKEGKGNAEDDQWYTDAAIRELCESGRAEGMQAYANHPDLEEEENRPERDIRHLIGTHTDVTYSREGNKGTAKSVFVPITTNENHPTYGWVTTLAEAAARNQGPQPLVGWSLYGMSAGDFGPRPDGTEGRLVNLIMPTSADMVTNAGAGGEFARTLMKESARRLRRVTNHTTQEDEPMLIGDFRTQMAEALKKLREASTDDERAAANTQIETLETEAAKIDKPLQVPDSIEALTEAAPALVTRIKEAAKVEGETEVEQLRSELTQTKSKLTEAETFITGITDVRQIADQLREAGVKDATELKYFAGKARERGLREAADIKDMVETERNYHTAQQDALVEKLREATGGNLDFDVEGVLGRSGGSEPPKDGGAGFLRESGIPVKASA